MPAGVDGKSRYAGTYSAYRLELIFFFRRCKTRLRIWFTSYRAMQRYCIILMRPHLP